MSSTQELDAVAVEEILSQPSPVTATVNFPLTITLFEQFGRAYISWSWDNPRYARGEKDLVQLREGNVFKGNFPTTAGIKGTVDTGHAWGSGLNAAYWAWNFSGGQGYKQLVETPNT